MGLLYPNTSRQWLSVNFSSSSKQGKLYINYLLRLKIISVMHVLMFSQVCCDFTNLRKKERS